MGGSKEGLAHLASSEVNAFGFHFGELAIPTTKILLVKKWLTTYERYCNGNFVLVSAVCEMGGESVIMYGRISQDKNIVFEEHFTAHFQNGWN